jgi:hypothetical protein
MDVVGVWSGPGLGSLCRSREEQRLTQRPGPSRPRSFEAFVARPRRANQPLGGPENQVGPCSHDEFLLTSHLQRPAGSKALAPLDGSLALTSSPRPLR